MSTQKENAGKSGASHIMTRNVKTLLPQISLPEGRYELLVRQLSEMLIVNDHEEFRGMFLRKLLYAGVRHSGRPGQPNVTNQDEFNAFAQREMALHLNCLTGTAEHQVAWNCEKGIRGTHVWLLQNQVVPDF